MPLVGVRVSPLTLSRLDQYAARLGMNRSEMLRWIIDNAGDILEVLREQAARHEKIDGQFSRLLLAKFPEATEDEWLTLEKIVSHVREMMKGGSREV